MPNWCRNRYAIQGKMGALIQFKNWIDGLYPTPRYHLAMEHSKKLFILGATGYFQPCRRMVFPHPFDALPLIYGDATFENQAYTDWLDLLAYPNFELNDPNSRQISNLFYATGAHLITFNDLDSEQQMLAEAIMNTQLHDWYNVPWCQVNSQRTMEDIFDSEPDVPEMGYPGDFYAVMPPFFKPMLNGFNGGLVGKGSMQRIMDRETSYNMNVFRYGTKWATFGEAELEIHNDTQASMDTDTAWSPPSSEFDCAMVEKFGLDKMNHRYIEEGYAFAGSRDVAIETRATVVEDAIEDCVVEWKEEDVKKYKGNEDALWDNCEQCRKS